MIKTLTKRALNREVILYLIFGVIAVVLNIALYYLFIEMIKLPIWLGNILDTLICILFQYITNRLWVFQSKNSGKDAVREFYYFLAARGVTAVLDQAIIMIGVGYFVTTFVAQNQQSMYGLGIKIMSNAIVIILNYIFSKKIIFKTKHAEMEN